MEFTFTLLEKEANLVLTALQELPAKLANPLTKKMQEQAQAQMPKPEPEQAEE